MGFPWNTTLGFSLPHQKLKLPSLSPTRWWCTFVRCTRPLVHTLLIFLFHKISNSKNYLCLLIHNLHVTLPSYFLSGDYELLDDENVTLSGNFSGRYRSYRGVSDPEICPPGSYCPSGTMHETEYLCPEGTYSNNTGLHNATQCTLCDPGMYCPGQGNDVTYWKIELYILFLLPL